MLLKSQIEQIWELQSCNGSARSQRISLAAGTREANKLVLWPGMYKANKLVQWQVYTKPTCRSLDRYSSGQQVNPMVHEINTVNPEAAVNEANRFVLRQLCMTSVYCYTDEHLGCTGRLLIPEIVYIYEQTV